jgi:SAM-dependent methyltransferase
MILYITKPEDIFNQTSKEDFLSLLQLAHSFDTSIDVDKLFNDYINDNVELKSVYAEWEKSVQCGKPNFALYGRDVYMNEAFIRWKLYSRRYLRLLRKYLTKPHCVLNPEYVKTVLDLGCGCGYTTLGLSSIFPNAHIYGTNLSGTLQYKIAEYMCKAVPNCTICDESHNADLPESPDLVFASEFFEHLDHPLVLLEAIVSKYRPKYFVFANTFTKMSLGHFEQYYDGNRVFTGKEMSREFTRRLKKLGYIKVYTKFYNNRPSIYMLREPVRNRPLFTR